MIDRRRLLLIALFAPLFGRSAGATSETGAIQLIEWLGKRAIDILNQQGSLNRPGFTGERLVQILGCFFMCVQGFIEHLLCFVRRDISDGAVKTLGVVPIDPFQRFPFKLAH